MSIQNEYLNGLMERVIKRDPAEPEFHQAVREVLTSLAPVANARPELIKEGVMDCLVEPERTIKFRVPWEDDQGNVHVNRGYRMGMTEVRFTSTGATASSSTAPSDLIREACGSIPR